MSRGKHLSLHEARKSGQLERFAKEHEAIGDRDAFDAVLKAMATGVKLRTAGAGPASPRGRKTPRAAGKAGAPSSAGSSGTRSRRDKLEGT